MPPVSEAQRRLAGAAASGKSKKMSKAVGKEYLASDPGGKLPARKKKKKKKGKKK